MQKLNKISSVYFLGIGGIGMSALARYFKSTGVNVSGYDKMVTDLTQLLEKEGIGVHYEDDISKADINADYVVYTPAIPATHAELNYFKANNYTLLKRSDVLEMITDDTFNICIAGTHGKTTTSAMIAHILRHSGFGCNAFLGGISANYDTNFWGNERKVSVVEADEYDRSFLKLSPDIAIITSMDADHLDIYGTEENMQDAFIAFSSRIKPGGVLISKQGLKRAEEMRADTKISYSVKDKNADARAENIRVINGSYFFDIAINEVVIPDMQLNMGGMHNIENAVASVVAVHKIGLGAEEIRKAVTDFKGVKRRFEYIIKTENKILIDDYAHHPEELRALISGAKELFPDKKCLVIFQPHLFSRTRDHAQGFGEVLSMADEVILLPVYPAREMPIAGVDSEMILKQIANVNKKVLNKNELIVAVSASECGLIIIAGAGDIDTMVTPLKKVLS